MVPLSRSLSPVRAFVALVLLVSLTFVGGSGTTALAKPVQSDRSDNAYYFTYDAAEGEITAEASSLQLKRRDPVDHQISIDTVPGSEVGRRLKATVVLRLNAKEKRAFRGRLGAEVRDAAAQVVYRSVRKVDFVLRAKKGFRSERFTFRFDLPSGDYTATSDFDAPPP